MRTPVIFERSRKGRKAYSLPYSDIPEYKLSDYLNESLIRDEIELPEVSELDILRHYSELASRNFSIEKNMYPLGSCTMKYNPRINEKLSRLKGFQELHPLTPPELSKGALQLMYELQEMLKEITGMDSATLIPAAGAHGEFTGLLAIRSYFKAKAENRDIVLIPDSAHGTNPASVRMAGFTPVTIKSNSDGFITADEIRKHLSFRVAAFMVTNPNTLGVFEPEIAEIIEILHENGSIAYMDGANMNALIGISRPGDIGFDIVQLNLHKTFSAPHGGGGPGSGPVLAKKYLEDHLPDPKLILENGTIKLQSSGESDSYRIKLFYGNFSVMVKAYVYLLMLGKEGLEKTSKMAVLNANYLKKIIKSEYLVSATDLTPMHEFVLSAEPLKKKTGIRALDIAKGLLDRGFHAPTMYFPLIVSEALMIEPTETESKETLDKFAEAVREITEIALNNPEDLRKAPEKSSCRRVDEARAAREPVLKWQRGR